MRDEIDDGQFTPSQILISSFLPFIVQNRLYAYLDVDAFDFYFEQITVENRNTLKAKNYKVVKDITLENFYNQNSEGEIKKDAISRSHDEGEVSAISTRAG